MSYSQTMVVFVLQVVERRNRLPAYISASLLTQLILAAATSSLFSYFYTLTVGYIYASASLNTCSTHVHMYMYEAWP